MVPVLVPQPLAGPTQAITADPATAPFPYGQQEHVSNIQRVEALLRLHPLVDLMEFDHE